MGMSSKDFTRLGPRAQKQVLQKLGAQQRQREKPRCKENKYHAKPADVVLPNGTVRHFDSEKEANRFRQLDLLQRAGEISDLRCQVPFELIPRKRREDNTWEQPCRYIADFTYRDGCRLVVEDVKGYTDPKSAAYKLYTVKRKLMLMIHGITIKEV